MSSVFFQMLRFFSLIVNWKQWIITFQNLTITGSGTVGESQYFDFVSLPHSRFLTSKNKCILISYYFVLPWCGCEKAGVF